MTDNVIPLPGVATSVQPLREYRSPLRLEGPDGYLVMQRSGDGITFYVRTLTGDRMNVHIESDKVQQLMTWLRSAT